MELKWLEDFLVLCSTENFRVASKQRHVSQPAFSRRIQSLEAWVDATLIDRSHHPSRLTEAGELFKPMAQEIVRLAYLARDDIRINTKEAAEKIRISTLGALAQTFIPVWLKELQPFIKADQFIVRTEYRTTTEYFAALEDDSVDFFVCFEDTNMKLRDNGAIFTSMKLGEESLVPVVSPNDEGKPTWWLPDAPKGPIACLHTFPKLSPWPIKDHLENRYSHLNFKTVYESSLGPTRTMAIEGFGLAWLPFAIIKDDLVSGRLVRAANQADDLHVDIMIYRCAKKQELRIENFWRALLNQNQVSPKPA